MTRVGLGRDDEEAVDHRGRSIVWYGVHLAVSVFTETALFFQ
jgi:hypothetical protein